MVALISEVAACSSSLITVLSGLLTPAIALITTYIAVQQYRVNKRQYTLALFEKRMAVFNATVKFIHTVAGGKVDLDLMLAFNAEAAQHEFLFRDDIKDYLGELRKIVNEIYELKDRGRNQSGGLAAKDRELLTDRETRFMERAGAVREKFLKYLDFRKP